MSLQLSSSLMAVARAEDLMRDLSISVFGTLEYRNDSGVASWPHFVKTFLNPYGSEHDLRTSIEQTARSVYQLLNDDPHMRDRGHEADKWRWAGRTLAMQHDAGKKIIQKLSLFLPEEERKDWKSQEIAKRLSRLAQEFIVVSASDRGLSADGSSVVPSREVPAALNALGRVCTQRGGNTALDSTSATLFARQLKGHAEINAFDIWVALWSRIEPTGEGIPSEIRCKGVLEATHRFAVWCERGEDRQWLIKARYVAEIASTWLGPLRREKEVAGKRVLVDSEGPVALVNSVCPRDGFAQAPKMVSYGPFLNYLEIQGPSTSYKDWHKGWKERGLDLSSKSFNALLKRLAEGVASNHMPDWTAFDEKWGFDNSLLVTTSGVRWIPLDILIFEGKLWEIAWQNPTVYRYILKKLLLPTHPLYIKQQQALTKLIRGEEEEGVALPSGVSLFWYDQILGVRERFITLVKSYGWIDDTSILNALRLAEAAAQSPGVLRHFWPTPEEWFTHVLAMAWQEYNLANGLTSYADSTYESSSVAASQFSEGEAVVVAAASGAPLADTQVLMSDPHLKKYFYS